MPWSCVCGACSQFGGVGAGAGCCVFPVSPCPPRVSGAVCGGPSRLGVPFPRSLARHPMRSVHCAGSVRLPFWFSPRVLCVCVCARALAASVPPPPLPGLVWRAQLARSRCWALVGPLNSVCAPPCVRPRSRAPFGLLGGGRPGPISPYLAWGCALPVGWVQVWGQVTNPTARALASWSCALAWRAVGAVQGRPGGAPLAWVRGARGRALSHPRPLLLSRVRPGPTTHWLWVRGVRARGPVTNPTARALASWLCALWGRHESAPGGAPLAWVWGVRGQALSHLRPLLLSGVRPGPTTLWLWMRGVRACSPVNNSTARALASWLCALWGRHEGAQGGRLLPGCGASGVGCSPTPDHSLFWACGRGHYPLAVGAGVQAWGPATNPTERTLACWLCALWGRHEGAQGGRLLPWCGASGVGRSPTPDLSSVMACGRGPLPTGCGCGGCGRGDPSPTPQRAPLRAGFARCGGGMRVPGGGASCLGVGHPGSGTLPTPTTRPFGRAAGAHYPLAVGAGGTGVGTRQQPHSARSCELALRAMEAARGRPGGAPPAWVWGVRGRALSHPRPLVGLSVRPGPTTHWLWVRGVRARGPVTNPTARSFASWPCALWGRHEGARGGRLLPGCGASGDGRSPTPDLSSVRACGRGPLPIGCSCGGCGREDPPPTPQRALLQAGFARCPGGMRVPGGGASCLGVGRPGMGALPPPTSRPFGRAAGAHYPLAVGAGDAGVGTRHQPHSARSCALWGRHEGARGGRLLPGCGASGVRRSPTPNQSFFRVCGRGPLPTGCGCGGCGRGDPSPTPQRALLRAAFARCGGGTRAPWGGRLLPGCGASGVGRSPTPDLSSVWACGRGPLPTGCGCGDCGDEDPSPTPQRALLRAGFARSGGGMRVPGGGTSCPGGGASGDGCSPTPDLSSVRACGRGPLPNGFGCWGCRGADPSPTPQCALLRAVGAA